MWVHLVSYTEVIWELFGTRSTEIIASKVQSSELKQWEETKEGRWQIKSDTTRAKNEGRDVTD